MFQRIFATALGAGIGVGLLIAALQHVALVPMILTAESYESGVTAHQHATRAWDIEPPTSIHVEAPAAFADEAHAHDHNASAEDAALSWRPVFTTIATTLTAVGFGLLLSGAFAVSGREVDMREGLLWGLAGFATFALAPAFGLPAELPGSVAGRSPGSRVDAFSRSSRRQHNTSGLRVLAAYSCGGSRGIGRTSPRSLFRPAECGNRRRVSL